MTDYGGEGSSRAVSRTSPTLPANPESIELPLWIQDSIVSTFIRKLNENSDRSEWDVPQRQGWTHRAKVVKEEALRAITDFFTQLSSEERLPKPRIFTIPLLLEFKNPILECVLDSFAPEESWSGVKSKSTVANTQLSDAIRSLAVSGMCR